MSKEYLDIPCEIKAESILDDGTFEAYGSMFGGDPDSYGDVVVKGAFADTIAKGGRNGFGVAMLWQHQPANPIGTWKTIEEDKKGLHLIGKLTRGVQQADEAYLLMKDGALKGMSIGYDVVEYSITDDKKLNKRTRFLKKVDLWEVSPVTFPALTRAQITNVKAIETARTERELEKALRDAGLSHKEALIMVNRCKPYLREVRSQKGYGDVLAELKKLRTQYAITDFLK